MAAHEKEKENEKETYESKRLTGKVYVGDNPLGNPWGSRNAVERRGNA